MTIHRHAAKRDKTEPDCIDEARRLGAVVLAVSGTGLLDLLIAHDGALLPVEVKTPGEPLTKAQAETLAALYAQDVSAWVVESRADVRRLLASTLPRWEPGSRPVEGEKKRPHRPGYDRATGTVLGVTICAEDFCSTSPLPGKRKCAKHEGEP